MDVETTSNGPGSTERQTRRSGWRAVWDGRTVQSYSSWPDGELEIEMAEGEREEGESV